MASRVALHRGRPGTSGRGGDGGGRLRARGPPDSVRPRPSPRSPTSNRSSVVLWTPPFTRKICYSTRRQIRTSRHQLLRLTASSELRRINIWSRDGRIVYSNEPTVRGRRFSINSEVATAFLGDSVSRFSHTTTPDNLPGSYLRSSFLSGATSMATPSVCTTSTRTPDRSTNGSKSTRAEVFFAALVASSVLFVLLWVAFAGAAQLLERKNRLLSEHAASERVLLADLTRSEERFRSLVSNASDVILIAAADGSIMYESPAVSRVMGYQVRAALAHRRSMDFILVTRPPFGRSSRTSPRNRTRWSQFSFERAIPTAPGANWKGSQRTCSRILRSAGSSSTTATSRTEAPSRTSSAIRHSTMP